MSSTPRRGCLNRRRSSRAPGSGSKGASARALSIILDPFLLLDHFQSKKRADYEAGFSLHPHRGIETVTYLLAGAVRHRDTLGNSGEIGPGDLQ